MDETWRAFWESQPVQAKRDELLRRLRDQRAGSTEVGEINAALDMMEWIRNLPGREMKTEAEKKQRARMKFGEMVKSIRRLRV